MGLLSDMTLGALAGIAVVGVPYWSVHLLHWLYRKLPKVRS